ncbi:MAG: fibronectin type III domain-containing protein [Aequoribacter sp.]|uniref:fibronectin type III domain-containing protein n=1 Tax=Aequoribacter sp. TaxID=2847771 RepID=UPI003C567020
MSYEITDVKRSGFYEAFCDGVRINRDGHSGNHTTENEAEQTIFWHASNNASEGDRVYEIQPAKSVFEVRVVGSVASQTGDTEAPTQPGSLLAAAQSATRIDLSWTASTDNVGVTGYQIFQDGNPITTVVGTTYSVLSLTPSTQYSFEVSAFDSAGNNSPNAGPALATTNSNSAPVWSLGNQSGETGGAINIDLDSVCTDSDGDTITYSLLSGTLPAGLALSGTRNETLSGTLSEADVDNFTLQASDGITTTDVAVTFTVTAPDTVPPAVPTGLAAGTTGQSTVPLTWDANGEGDLNYYSIYRSTDDVNFGKVTTDGAQTTTSFTDTGRSASTTYYYTVTATDDSDNESAQSASISATTAAFSADPFDLSSYSIPFSYSWPSAPVSTSSATVTPATIGANLVAGRTLTLQAGSYGDLSIFVDDLTIIQQAGANIDTLYYAGVSRLTVKPETPRVGSIGDINSNSSGDASDILFDGIFQLNNSNTPNFFANNRFYGSRIAVVNSSINTHGYCQAGFSTSFRAINNFIWAGNYCRSDSGISVPFPSSESLFRMVGPQQFIIVGNYFDKVTGGLGLRIHADQADATDGYIADNVIIGSRSSTTFNAMFIARSGGDSPAQDMDNILIEDNDVYNQNGALILTTSTPAQSPEASSMTLRNNNGYSGSSWPTSQTGWTFSNNSNNSYQTPPTSVSKVGF